MCEVAIVQGSDSLAVLLSCSLALCIAVPHTITCTHPPTEGGLGFGSVWSSQLIPICYNQLLHCLRTTILVYFQSPRKTTIQMQSWMFVLTFEPSYVVQQVRDRNDITLDVFDRCRKQNSTAPPLENPAREPTSSSPSRVSPHTVTLSNTITLFLL